MTPKEAAERMAICKQVAEMDPEVGHGEADELLCEILRALGYEEAVKTFQEMEKWYA